MTNETDETETEKMVARMAAELEPGNAAREEESLVGILSRLDARRARWARLVAAGGPDVLVRDAERLIEEERVRLVAWCAEHDGPWEQWLRALHPDVAWGAL